MATDKTDVTQTIRRFVGTLEEDICVEKVILFGSRAKGASRSDSDIDVIVVSPSFAEGRHIKHMQYLFRRAARVDSRLEPIPASPEDIRRADERTFLGQALASGRVCYLRKGTRRSPGVAPRTTTRR